MKYFTIPLFLLFLIFHGCLHYEQQVQLEEDGSGTLHLHYWTEGIPAGIADSVALPYFTADSLEVLFTAPGVAVNSHKVYTDPSDGSLHTELQLSFSYLDSLNAIPVFESNEFSLTPGADGQLILTQFIPPVATGYGYADSTESLVYEYTFPGEIITHNAQKKEEQTLRWQYSPSEIAGGKTISVTYKKTMPSTPVWVYLLAGAVSLLVLYALLRKKR